MQNMLITGANGFLGARLAGYFAARYQVATPTHAEMDLTNPAQVEAVVRQFAPNIVLHCAAVSDVKACEADPVRSQAINVGGTEAVAAACAKIGAKLIFCSSDQIYFGSDGLQMHTEDEPVTPCNVYGRQKLQAEQQALALCPTAVCLRLSWMYDWRTVLPAEHSDLYRTLKDAVQNSKPLAYPVHDYRGITYVGALLQAVEQTFGLPGGVYNFGSENNASTYETVTHFLALLGAEGYPVEQNTKAFADRPRNLTMSLARLCSFGIPLPDTVAGFAQCAAEEAAG